MAGTAAQNKDYTQRLKQRLLDYYGNKCNSPGCSITYMLEFAHLAPTKLRGENRGSKHRLLDIQRNKNKYTLLCTWCHSKMDGTAPRMPPPEEWIPF